MGLRKKIRSINNYQVKLFLPVIIILWVVVISIWVTQYNRDKEYRSDMIRSRLTFMNAYALYLTENGYNSKPYFTFLEKYYDNDSSVFDNLSITLYEKSTRQIMAQRGFPAPPPDFLGEKGRLQGSYIAANNNDDSTYITPDRSFYYRTSYSKDSTYLVQTILPLDGRVKAEIKGSPWMRLMLLVCCAVITLVLYIVGRHMTKNIKLLRQFVDRAATDHEFAALDEFPADDLGEISKQVVNIYNMRKAAMASRELEHRVALKAIEERATLKRQLTNNINHELKTPAGIVKGYIDTIIENPDMDSESRQHFLLKTQEHIERLCNILNDLSTITRLDEGSQNINVEKINFTEFIDNLVSDVEESGINQDMAIKVNIPKQCYVKGNYSLLMAVIMNLVKNAAAYSRGTEMGIRLLTENQKFYTFIFYDNGVGVPEESVPLLFERFFRVDKGRSRKSGGTGLGLPIVRNSLNTLGGSISVKNGDNGGLQFAFTLMKWTDDEPKQG